MSEIGELISKILEFRDARDWKQFHTPRNLAAALAIEVALPDDEALLAELSALRYSFNARGKIKVEEKDAARRRLGRSPDLADAAVLGAPLGSNEIGAYFFY